MSTKQPLISKNSAAAYGFTIVELLIVIVVVGILAAIVVIAYRGIQESSRATAIQSDLANAKKKLQIFKTQSSDERYPDSTADLLAVGIRPSKTAYDQVLNNFYYCFHEIENEFAIGARTPNNGSAYRITSTTNVQKVASVSADSGCQSLGLTGYADANAWTSNGHSEGPPAVWALWTGP